MSSLFVPKPDLGRCHLPARGPRVRLPASLVGGAVALALVASSAPALAGGDEAAAEALFIEAKKLAADGKFSEACPKFAESNRLDRGAGTLIHLADCYEKNNQSASAWATFRDASSAAQALGRADWQKLATTRAANLEPKLAKLTIRVTQPVDKIEVTRDGSAMSQASWNVAIPIDVGTHTVQATAPGYKAFKTTVLVTNDGDRKEVTVTQLEVLPVIAGAGAAPAPVGPGPQKDGSSQRTIGFVVGGVGVVGLAVGAVTGLVAIGKNNDSKKLCSTDGACASADAVSANDSAKTFGTVSTIAFIAGGVGVVAGALLVLTAPSAPSSQSAGAGASRRTARGFRIVPATDGRSGGLSVSGAF